MNGILSWWEARCGSVGLLRFIDICLRGIGHVLFQDNPVSGLLFLLPVGWGSVAAGVPEVVIGAMVSVVATLAVANLMRTWGIAALTAPFVLVTWVLLLSAYAFSSIHGEALPSPGQIAPIPDEAANPLAVIDFVHGMLISISQVFVKGNGIAALLMLVGLAAGSLAAAGFAVAAALISVIVAHALGVESLLITAGLTGFNPILTAIALGTVFHRPDLRVVIYALVATVLTVMVQGAMVSALTPFGIPTLTASFVLVAWLFLLPGLKLD